MCVTVFETLSSSTQRNVSQRVISTEKLQRYHNKGLFKSKENESEHESDFLWIMGMVHIPKQIYCRCSENRKMFGCAFSSFFSVFAFA